MEREVFLLKQRRGDISLAKSGSCQLLVETTQGDPDGQVQYVHVKRLGWGEREQGWVETGEGSPWFWRRSFMKGWLAGSRWSHTLHLVNFIEQERACSCFCFIVDSSGKERERAGSQF